jgi:dipeptidyl-peptidase-4
LIPPRLGDVVSLLRRQGILVDAITQPTKTRVEAFTVESLSVDSLFEGHRPVRLEGRWSSQAVDTALGAGWYSVKTNQPLGVLAAYLLEPASEDGIVTWNLLDRELQAGAVYPIHRLRAAWLGSSLAVP